VVKIFNDNIVLICAETEPKPIPMHRHTYGRWWCADLQNIGVELFYCRRWFRC